MLPSRQTSLGGDILEEDWSDLDEAPGSDGPMLRIEHRGMRAASGGSASRGGLCAFVRRIRLRIRGVSTRRR